MVLRPKFQMVEVHGDVKYALPTIGCNRWRQGYLKITWDKEEALWLFQLHYEAKDFNPVFHYELTQKSMSEIPKNPEKAEKAGYMHIIFKNGSNVWVRRNVNSYKNTFYAVATLLVEIKEGNFEEYTECSKRNGHDSRSRNSSPIHHNGRWNENQQKTFYNQQKVPFRGSPSKWVEMNHHQNRNFERMPTIRTYSRSNNWSSNYRNKSYSEADTGYNSPHYQYSRFADKRSNSSTTYRRDTKLKSEERQSETIPKYRKENDLKFERLYSLASGDRSILSQRLSGEDNLNGHIKDNLMEGNSRSPLKSLSSNNSNSETPKRPLLEFSIPSKRLRSGEERVDSSSSDNLCEKVSPQLRGFQNLGNSCYMNSILQALFSLGCFTDSLLRINELAKEKLSEGTLFRCIVSLLLAKIKGDYSQFENLLEEIKNAVCAVASDFRGNYQHDAHEFLGQVLDQIKEEVFPSCKELKVSNLIEENFEFQLLNSYLCQGCFQVVANKQTFNMLSLDVPKLQNSDNHGSLQDALDIYFLPQNLEFTCEKCHYKNSRCLETFATLPRILVLHLKRYSFNQQSVKVAQPVTIPSYLTLKDHTSDSTVPLHPVSTESCHNNQNKKDVQVNSENKVYGSRSITNLEKTTQVHTDSSNSTSTNLLSASVNSKDSKQLDDNSEMICIRRKPRIQSQLCLKYGDVRRMTSPRVPPVGLCGGREDEASIPSIGEENKENHLPYDHSHESAKDVGLENDGEPDCEVKDMQTAVEQSLQEAESQEELELQKALQNSIEDVSEWNLAENGIKDSGEFWISRKEEEKKKLEENFESGHLPNSYQLISIVSHIGQTAHSGHYLSDVYDLTDDCWWQLNDNIVQKSTKCEILHQRETSGYLFFYVAKEVIESYKSQNENTSTSGHMC